MAKIEQSWQEHRYEEVTAAAGVLLRETLPLHVQAVLHYYLGVRFCDHPKLMKPSVISGTRSSYSSLSMIPGLLPKPWIGKRVVCI